MTRAALLVVALAACGGSAGGGETPIPSSASQMPAPVASGEARVATARERLVSPEAFLRSYLVWFGNLAPRDLPKQAGHGLFDQWVDYLGALGLPDYRVDIPRAGQSNAIMLAAVGRLGEALCIRAAEHDLKQATPLDQRQIFAFDRKPQPSLDEFRVRFDVLHRTFLSYPVVMAPPDRVPRFYALYQKIEADRGAAKAPLTADETAWVAVCSALVQHPEARVY